MKDHFLRTASKTGRQAKSYC